MLWQWGWRREQLLWDRGIPWRPVNIKQQLKHHTWHSLQYQDFLALANLCVLINWRHTLNTKSARHCTMDHFEEYSYSRTICSKSNVLFTTVRADRYTASLLSDIYRFRQPNRERGSGQSLFRCAKTIGRQYRLDSRWYELYQRLPVPVTLRCKRSKITVLHCRLYDSWHKTST